MRKLFRFLLVLVLAFSFIPNVNAQSLHVQSDTLDWGYKYLGKTMVNAYNITGSVIAKKSIVALDTSQFIIVVADTTQTNNPSYGVSVLDPDSFTTDLGKHEGNPWQVVVEFANINATDTIFIAGTVYSTRNLTTGDRDANQQISHIDTVIATDSTSVSSFHFYDIDSTWSRISESPTYTLLGAPIFAVTPATVGSLAVGVISASVLDSGVVNLTLFGHIGEGTFDGQTNAIPRGSSLKAAAGNDFILTVVDSLTIAKAAYYSNNNDQYGVVIMK